MKFLTVILLLCAGVIIDGAQQRVAIKRKSVWKPNKKVDKTLKRMQASCTFTLQQEYKKGTWTIDIILTKATEKLKIWIMNVESQANDGQWYSLKSKYEYQPQIIEVAFQLDFRGPRPNGFCESNLPEVVHETTTTTVATTVTTTTTTNVPTESSAPTTETVISSSSVAPPSTTSRTTLSTSVPIVVADNHTWPSGDFMKMKGKCLFRLSEALEDFEIVISFNKATYQFQTWIGTITQQHPKGRWYDVKNSHTQHPPQMLVEFFVAFQGDAPSGTCEIKTDDTTITTRSPTSTEPTTSQTTTSLPVSSKQTTPVQVTTKLTTTSLLPETTKQTTTSLPSETTEPTTLPPGTTEQMTVTTTTETNPATSTTAVTTVDPQTLNTKYDYREVLRLSILFYEAQRSGKLPANNRIPYRGDSALGDKADDGSSLTGGWYDAGDGVKFNLPMAASTTLLAWGLTMFEDAYVAAGQLDYVRDSIKWPLDYFLKCWKPGSKTYYAQVGNGDVDHAYWGRHEEMTMQRPAFKVDVSNPGSDVAADTAAALTAGYLAFKSVDSSYANTLLDAAKSLYDFANQYKGKYSDSIPNAAKFYNSYSGFRDELCYSAALLYKATGDNAYLAEAKIYVDLGTAWAQDWDNKMAACQVMLYELVPQNEKSTYANSVESFLRAYMPGGSVGRTPDGLAWRAQWGSLRYSANAAFIGLAAAHLGIGNTQGYKEFARSQIHFILGDNKYQMSYVVGFGDKYPLRPHHRASSCPDRPASCSWDDFNKDAPNPQILYGALVGGPDQSGNYDDRRNDYIKNEVTCDYNAGFQSAVAGLLHFALRNEL